MDRRVFLSRIVQVLSALIAGLLGLPFFRFLSASFAEEDSATWYPIANTDSLAEEVTQIEYVRLQREGWQTRIAPESVWVRRKPDGSYVVFGPHCTHLGCNYAWNPDAHQFQCPCHGGKFDINGNRIAGPPPRPLDRYESKLSGRTLFIRNLKRA